MYALPVFQVLIYNRQLIVQTVRLIVILAQAPVAVSALLATIALQPVLAQRAQ